MPTQLYSCTADWEEKLLYGSFAVDVNNNAFAIGVGYQCGERAVEQLPWVSVEPRRFVR